MTTGYVGNPGASNLNWIGDDADYLTVHKRLWRSRGKASEHWCEHCDSKAQEWSYDGKDPNEKVGTRGRRYSVDLERYFPVCKSCHLQFGKQTHCGKGHEMTKENTWTNGKTGQSRCRTCRSDNLRRFKERKRQ